MVQSFRESGGTRPGQVQHGSATTTAAVRRAIQHSQASLRQLAKRNGINPKTVTKWKKRASTADRKTGPTEPKSTVLSIEDEAVVVAFRRHTLLPLDDCLYALQPTIPHLTRSSLYRCFQPTASRGCPTPTATSRYARGSSPIRSATSTLLSPTCGPRKVGSTCSWRSTGPPSLPSSSCTRRPPAGSPATSCGPLSLPFLTRSTPCSPTTSYVARKDGSPGNRSLSANMRPRRVCRQRRSRRLLPIRKNSRP